MLKLCRVLLSFFQMKFQFEACILRRLIVSALAAAFALDAAISMPPVPIVAIFAVWTFMHPNAISFIAPWIGSDSSLESVFGAGPSTNCLLSWILIFWFWIHGVRFCIFVTQWLGAFFHTFVPSFWFIVFLAFGNAVVSFDTLVCSIKAHVFLAQVGAALGSKGQFIVATLTGTARGIATTRNLLFCLPLASCWNCPQGLK